ncbi:Urease accessory protein UreD [Methylobacterium crusticola]|uniref:Urease accessory protein UreD n=1 Tax=Methylobacterium crusticola TaxID=1697972 RepID=A0ABQ4QRD0_9HYPH|nr:urease accessory protein UreD [Methylobacterium crusticola]GJD47838.1 Urease accessory protein UreD [Methylobacterium crusticola]
MSLPADPDPAWKRRQRSRGHVALAVVRTSSGATRVSDLAESGPLRLRLPRPEPGPLEAVLLNSAGGIACGDAFEVEAALGPATDVVLTTTAAEKIYRSDGPTTALRVALALDARAALAWLPQETILYDGARLVRRLEADLAADARLTLFEALVFGRAARGETVRSGMLHDHWRVRRGGRLVYADSLRLEGPVADRLARPAIAGGARALATLLHVAPDAEARLEEARALLAASGCEALGVEAGASAWNGLMALRLLAPEIGALRTVAARIVAGFRGRPMPRVWQT